MSIISKKMHNIEKIIFCSILNDLIENKEFQNEEIWKEIAGFPNYAVSNRGRVMNLKTGRVLKPGVNSHGYAFVVLYNGDGKPKNCTTHRLVAEAFIPNPQNLPQVDHVDENKGNNDVSNLRWVSASKNVRHSNHQRSCRINQLTLDGELIRTWDSSEQIKRELGYHSGSIIHCCKGKHKQVYGFRWQYAEPSQQRKLNRPVAALTMDRDLICEYKSATEASRCLKINRSLIRNCLNGTCKSTHGLRFIYLD